MAKVPTRKAIAPLLAIISTVAAFAESESSASLEADEGRAEAEETAERDMDDLRSSAGVVREVGATC